MHLQILFDEMDFIASAKPGTKPCFNGKYYVDSDSIIGAIYRSTSGESQSGRGNDCIRSCCTKATQAYSQYLTTQLGPIILTKLMDMRKGISTIIETYSNNSKHIATCNSLKNSILSLDMKITPEILAEHGIIPPIDHKSMIKPLPIVSTSPDPLPVRSYGSVSASIPLPSPSMGKTPSVHSSVSTNNPFHSLISSNNPFLSPSTRQNTPYHSPMIAGHRSQRQSTNDIENLDLNDEGGVDLDVENLPM